MQGQQQTNDKGKYLAILPKPTSPIPARMAAIERVRLQEEFQQHYQQQHQKYLAILPKPTSSIPAEKKANGDNTNVSNKHDVLCYKGSKSITHPGNVFYRERVNCRRFLYALLKTSCEKRALADMVFNEVAHKGGRFLEKKGEFCYEMSKEIAIQKILKAWSQSTKEENACNAKVRRGRYQRLTPEQLEAKNRKRHELAAAARNKKAQERIVADGYSGNTVSITSIPVQNLKAIENKAATTVIEPRRSTPQQVVETTAVEAVASEADKLVDSFFQSIARECAPNSPVDVDTEEAQQEVAVVSEVNEGAQQEAAAVFEVNEGAQQEAEGAQQEAAATENTEGADQEAAVVFEVIKGAQQEAAAATGEPKISSDSNAASQSVASSTNLEQHLQRENQWIHREVARIVQREVNQLHSKLEENENTIKKLQNTLEETEGTVQLLRNKVGEMSSYIQEQNSTIQDLHRKLDENKSTVQVNKELSKKYEEKEQLYKELRKKLEENKSTVQVNKELSKKYEEKEQLYKELRKKLEEKDCRVQQEEKGDSSGVTAAISMVVPEEPLATPNTGQPPQKRAKIVNKLSTSCELPAPSLRFSSSKIPYECPAFEKFDKRLDAIINDTTAAAAFEKFDKRLDAIINDTTAATAFEKFDKRLDAIINDTTAAAAFE